MFYGKFQKRQTPSYRGHIGSFQVLKGRWKVSGVVCVCVCMPVFVCFLISTVSFLSVAMRDFELDGGENFIVSGMDSFATKFTL